MCTVDQADPPPPWRQGLIGHITGWVSNPNRIHCSWPSGAGSCSRVIQNNYRKMVTYVLMSSWIKSFMCGHLCVLDIVLRQARRKCTVSLEHIISTLLCHQDNEVEALDRSYFYIPVALGPCWISLDWWFYSWVINWSNRPTYSWMCFVSSPPFRLHCAANNIVVMLIYMCIYMYGNTVTIHNIDI